MLCSSMLANSNNTNGGAATTSAQQHQARQHHQNNSGGGGGISRLSNFLKACGARKHSSAQKSGASNIVDSPVIVSHHHHHQKCDMVVTDVENVKPVKAKLEISFEQLVKMVTKRSDDNALTPDEECIICVTRRACIRSYPCGHNVLCEKCFVKLLQINYMEGKYPVTCVFCRRPVALYRRQEAARTVIRRCSPDSPGLKASVQQTPMTSSSLSHHGDALSPLPSSSIRRPGYL